MTGVPFRVKALYEYSSPHEDDLPFPEGTIITVTDEEDDDWYGGEYVDDSGAKQEGIFPRNFVEKIEPQAPPRPARTRTKKQTDSMATPVQLSGPEPQPSEEPEPEPEPEPQAKAAVMQGPDDKETETPEVPPVPVQPSTHPTEPEPVAESAPAPPPTIPAPSEPAAPEPAPATKPTPISSKPSKPPVSAKPSSNAFKDRIAAFNTPSAAPIAPVKPAGWGSGSSGGFVKKPFVAPPPRGNYVPPATQATQPQKIYKRDEDPEIREQEAEAQASAEKAGLASASGTSTATGEGEEEEQKPTSLKERIALLQKQQREQGQRRAEAQKDKPKQRPVSQTQRTSSQDTMEATEEQPQLSSIPPVPAMPAVPGDHETEEPVRKASIDSERPPLKGRKSSRGPVVEPYHDGNEADMSGAGDTTEGQEDLTEREDSDDKPHHSRRAPTGLSEPRKSMEKGPEVQPDQEDEEDGNREEDEEEEEEEEEDPEARRKRELRERMMKLSGAGPGGAGMVNIFGGPSPGAPPKATKKSKPKQEPREAEEHPASTPRPVPVPGMMMLPGMGAPQHVEEPADIGEPVSAKPPTSPRAPPPPPGRPSYNQDDEEEQEPDPVQAPSRSSRDLSGPPPIPGGRPAPPAVPTASRPPPPPAPADVPETEGSESGDEMSGTVTSQTQAPVSSVTTRSPPPLPPTSVGPPPPAPGAPVADDIAPQSPPESAPAPSKRNSRPPPPIPGTAPVLPPAPPGQNRPPPPPPPGGPGSLSRQSTQDASTTGPSRSTAVSREADSDEEEEVTEYEGDYDTDIASSVPHKDALKSHNRDSSLEDNSSMKSPTLDAPTSPPPVPTSNAPRAVPPPIPNQPLPPPTNERRSVDMPRTAPPPPPPTKDTPSQDDEYDPFNYSAPKYGPRTPKIEEESTFQNNESIPSLAQRAPPPAPPGNRGAARQSMDLPRASTNIRRSMDAHRPSMESGFIASDIDLASQSGWWRQPNSVPPILQGRRDIYVESEEDTSTNEGTKTVVTRTIYVLFLDYSQTILTVAFDPNESSDVELDQRHEPPPRALRQDQLEQSYERFGRAIASAVSSKKDTVVGDGTPHSLVHELLRPFRDALAPIGTRAYGALVYSNLANASTQQNDEIRAGDIVSIRNAKFQGKHGAMHAKYSAEVGKPDHVGVVAEWDGTKKKIRAWEQGRENKKVKMESFKLDDLRSGEVKVWRVMPRSWVSWNSQP